MLPNRFGYLARSLRYALVAVTAFVLGSATIASAAAPGGLSLGTLFFRPLINGVATSPCHNSTTGAGTTTTCHAVVDAMGQLSTTDADTHAALAKNQYDAAGNLKVTSQGSSTVSGSVSVNNLPAVQAVGGSVGVNNFPATQTVNGNVGVSGTVNVGNLPATQTVHVDNMAVAGGFPVATKGQSINVNVPKGAFRDIPVGMTVTYAQLYGCQTEEFFLTGGGSLPIAMPATVSFPAGGISVDFLRIHNELGALFIGCDTNTHLIGY